MSVVFTAEFFRGNRARLRELVGTSTPVVITGNGLIQRSTSETYPFKQDSNFWYLTGIDEPNMVLVMDGNAEYLMIPQLSHYQEVFDGGLTPAELSAVSGIETVLSADDGWNQLQARLKKESRVATIAAPPAFIDTYGMYTSPARAALVTHLQKISKSIEISDVSPHLQRMRMVKQPVELDAIKQAVAATIAGVNTVHKKYLAGRYVHEFDATLDLDREFWKHRAEAHSFAPIIASGERGLTLHVSDKTVLDPTKQLLVDVGADYQHYAADISRTWMKNPSKRFMQVRDAVADVADYAMQLLKPGVVLRTYEKQVERYMGKKLQELGLIKTADSESIRHYFPHATSHYLGLDVHDSGDYEYPIEPGVVLTVEPGIYIPEEGIGVRIEDDVVITADGCINLSAKLQR